MKKGRKTPKKSAKSPKRAALALVVIAGLAVIATGAVITSRRAAVKTDSGKQQSSAPAAAASNKNYTTVRVAGQDLQVDSQTGRLKPLTPEEAQRLAEGLRHSLNRSTEGLVSVENADGSESVKLDGRFQNVAVARRNEDGSVTEGCVDNAQAAGEFFGIDPQLIDKQAAPASTQGQKQPRITTLRN